MLHGLVIGGGEILILMAALLLIFGASEISGYGKKIREMITNFRQSMRGETVDEDSPPGETS